jgi:hypothetical protein
MAQEENEGIAYLMALRRNTGAAAPAPAREAQSDNEASQHPPGLEKRRSPRYKCEGSAEMREMSCEVRTWATLTDISLHGCYVEAQATYPVGTVLQLKLTAHGIKVEASGNVRVSYPYLGMGIAFVDMTEENRARLKDLVASLRSPAVIVSPGIASSAPVATLDNVPLISDPQAAVQALLDFFRDRQSLLRDDFLRVLRESQLPRS